MKVTDTKIPDVKIIEPEIFEDERGLLFEEFALRDFQRYLKNDCSILQHNQSYSHKHVLRGLHFQDGDMAVGKLVTVVQGEIFDVVVDLRPESHSFGEWVGVYLSGNDHKQIWIPQGFAHGFLSLEHNTIVTYGLTGYYHPPSERTILWNDEMLKITWPLEGEPILSARDSNVAETFRHYCDMWGVKGESGVS